MKFRTSRDALLRPLRVVTGVVERRQTLPVLTNLLVEADENGLTLRGTDLEVEIIARVTEGVEVERPGASTIPAHKLTEIWNSLPDEALVSVGLEDDRAVVRAGRSRFALATIAPSEFPKERAHSDLMGTAVAGAEGEAAAAAAETGAEIEITLPHSDMRRLMDRTKFAMAVSDVRYFLNGMLLEVSDAQLRAAASDGHRMALCTLSGGAPDIELRRVIVPRKSVQDLERLIGDSDADVVLSVGATYLRASQGEYTLTTKLVDGDFPDVDRLIPRNTDHSVTADRETFSLALRRAAILSNEKVPEVRLHIDGEQMVIKASNPEQEEAEEHVAVDYDGRPMEIGFDARYLQDVFGALDTESVRMSMPEGNTIALIEGPGAEDALYIVMPIRL